MSIKIVFMVALATVLAVSATEAVRGSTLSFWNGDIATNILGMADGTHNPYREVNEFLNGMFYSSTGLEFISAFVIQKLGSELGYYMVSYLRDLFAGTLVYWLTAGVWHIVIYRIYGQSLFIDKGRPFPTSETIIDQMTLAQASLFVYAALPILSEYLIESNLTKTYYYIDQIGGWGYYSLYFVIYLSIVEVGIYWMHRTLHTNKFLYKYIHALHHKYNKQITMTPWCSIAFNPIDGILQASPYVITLFFVPMHYFTHLFLIFFSGMWATNIHDAIWGDSEPIMGAKYHLMHHTHYHYNFGQFFIFCDCIFGSLKVPEKSKLD